MNNKSATANVFQSINCNNKLIFHHIPKCGGSSLRETLRMSLMCSGIEPNSVYVAGHSNPNIMTDSDIELANHRLAKAFAVLAHIDIRLISKIKGGPVITCIRHPIMRAISAFNHFTLMNEPKCEDLLTMFRNNRSRFNKLFSNLYSRPGAYGLNHTDYSYVIIYERLQDDVPKMLKKLGLSNVPLPHIDPSPRTSKIHPSRFIYDESNPDHREIWSYLEQRLLPDIKIYEHYCNSIL